MSRATEGRRRFFWPGSLGGAGRLTGSEEPMEDGDEMTGYQLAPMRAQMAERAAVEIKRRVGSDARARQMRPRPRLHNERV